MQEYQGKFSRESDEQGKKPSKIKKFLIYGTTLAMLSGCASYRYAGDPNVVSEPEKNIKENLWKVGSEPKTNEQKKIYENLCIRNDIAKILYESDVPYETKSDFINYACSEEKNEEKLMQMERGIPKKDVLEISRAFESNGYVIRFHNELTREGRIALEVMAGLAITIGIAYGTGVFTAGKGHGFVGTVLKPAGRVGR